MQIQPTPKAARQIFDDTNDIHIATETFKGCQEMSFYGGQPSLQNSL
jgi:hypothetical protein